MVLVEPTGARKLVLDMEVREFQRGKRINMPEIFVSL